MSDRTVHAECDGFAVVRYDRSGKWYVEPKGDRPRKHVSVHEAVRRAEAAQVLGGPVYLGCPGGRTFDRLFAAAVQPPPEGAE